MRAAAGVALVVALMAVVACGGSSKTPIGTLADVGFRPSANGFTFQNYGDTLSDGSIPTNLTAANVETMFGSGVCASDVYGFCVLNPAAQSWLNSTNAAMAGGHRFGFSVAAELLWGAKLNPKKFGAQTTPFLSITDNQILQSQIAYDWALQLLNSVQSQRVTGTPNHILAKLRQVLTAHPSDTYTLAIWKSDGTGGHAITPYSVVNKGHGQFQVLIYDNNWPDTTRAISFDTKADTWSYEAASNPNDPSELYQGDAQTQTISLFPTSPGLGSQPCPFCRTVPASSGTGALGSAAGSDEIYLEGGLTNRANLVVTDPSGNRLGTVNGKLVDQIPGGYYTPVISSPTWQNKITPFLFVPADRTYTLSLDGTALAGPDTETLGLIGPASSVSVEHISVRPGDRNRLTVAPDATKVSYTTSRAQSSTLEVGVSDSRADYSFVISGVSTQAGGTINLSLPAESGSLSMNIAGTQASKINLTMTRDTRQGRQVFSHRAIALAGSDTAQLQFGNWTGAPQAIPLVVTHDGHQSTELLSDQSAPAVAISAPAATKPSTGSSGPAGSTAAGATISAATAATGAIGATGATRATSATRTAGAAGAPGPAGTTGATGATGSTGSPGVSSPPKPRSHVVRQNTRPAERVTPRRVRSHGKPSQSAGRRRSS
jgi:hypothetical protein